MCTLKIAKTTWGEKYNRQGVCLSGTEALGAQVTCWHDKNVMYFDMITSYMRI